MMLAYNEDTGASAARSFGPNHDFASTLRTALPFSPVSSTDGFGLSNLKSADDLRSHFASITIQTSPEVAQQAINEIINHPDGKYTTYWNNCTTTCAKVLRDLGLFNDHPVIPEGMMNLLYERYGNGKARESFWGTSFQNGKDYGHGKPGYDPFEILFRSVHCYKTTATWTENGKVTGVSSTYYCGP